MADFRENQYLQNRPFHRAYLDAKLRCPCTLCKSNCGKVFFEKKGNAQHFRIKHSGILFDEENNFEMRTVCLDFLMEKKQNGIWKSFPINVTLR